MKGLLICLVGLLCFGCASTPYQAPDICKDSDSIILKIIPNPTGASLVFQLANLEALKYSKVYTVHDANALLDHVEEFLNKDISTYSALAIYVMNKAKIANKLMGTEVILLSSYLDMFASKRLPITECDKALLRLHIEKQRQMIALYTD